MSALLKISRTIDNGVWKIVFDLEADKLSASDKDLISKFGEPRIDTGGTFSTGSNQYTLPSNIIRVVTELPFTQSFDSTTAPFNTATAVKAQAFQDSFTTKYTTAFATLRANPDTFTGEFLVNV
jgi:hypothetical protein